MFIKKAYKAYCNKMRQLLYEPLVASYTNVLYRTFLDGCVDNSVILDIGIGDGSALCKSADIIKKSNLRIVGIDICRESLTDCHKNIEEHGLEENIEAGLPEELPNLHGGITTFDYAFLSNSYSVIDDIQSCIKNAFDTTKDKQCVIALALYDKPSPILSFIKRNFKHILGFDCGRYITHNELSEELDTMNAVIVSKDLTITKTLFGFPIAQVFTLTIAEKTIFVDDIDTP